MLQNLFPYLDIHVLNQEMIKFRHLVDSETWFGQ